MKTREELHQILCEDLGSEYCYFSPPSNVNIVYPCIVYEMDGSTTLHADNKRYFHRKRYKLTVIDECEDSKIPGILFMDERLVYLEEERQYIADGLYHFSYTLYF